MADSGSFLTPASQEVWKGLTQELETLLDSEQLQAKDVMDKLEASKEKIANKDEVAKEQPANPKDDKFVLELKAAIASGDLDLRKGIGQRFSSALKMDTALAEVQLFKFLHCH